ncbi:MAG TPA: PSD1 and planctomycete cytochrome C domain-containing protein [Chthoniobacteraceae bacterium]|jgi:mono/diheme cytochrome c family protein|nr:PSD1 and planctomycete cytochrome C domain-containing protein [Chthoniobacteraceae bacterium]
MPLPRSWLFAAVLSLAAGARAEETVDYLRQVKPILTQRCFSCHGALKQKAGLRLDTGESIRRGGRNGAIVQLDDIHQSELLLRITSIDKEERMPAEGAPLKPEQIQLIEAWLRQGAPSPADEKPEPDPRAHWAFQPPVKAAVPAGAANPIDAFIAAGLARQGLTPQPPAAKPTLLRRVYLDLIGLPPTREELHAFLADEAPDAYERVVDRLLNDPRHGERWARHWMDVWRYADWYGRRPLPDVWNSAPQIWRWRDWIVRSLNTDKGYDQMVREMLAGDEIAPEDDEVAVATGFLVRNWYALNQNQWMRDNVEHTGKAFLGLTLNCTHCHDHKYDPITQREYFQFRAFFEPLDLRQDRWPGGKDPGPFQHYEYVKSRPVVQEGSIRVFDSTLEAKTVIYLGGDERNVAEGKPPVYPAPPAILGGPIPEITPISLPPQTYYPGLKPFVQEAQIGDRETTLATARGNVAAAQSALVTAKAKFDALTANDAADARAKAFAELLTAESAVKAGAAKLAAAEADLESVNARIAAENARYQMTEGDADQLAGAASKAERLFNVRAAEQAAAEAEASLALLKAEQELAAARRQAEALNASKTKEETDKEQAALKTKQDQMAKLKKAVETARTALQAESIAYTPLTPVYPKQSSGRRRALAEWITDRRNPLAARVAVNHLWLRHFQSPLVRTVFDFGRNGAAPTHPELLDWLAVELMDSGWSMKKMHRLIVTSNAYRMESKSDAHNVAIDPENRALWRMNAGRMETEVVRDSILQLAGELDPQLGGPTLENTEQPKSHRRSLYFACFPEGGGSSEFNALFDPPSPAECYRRTRTVIPQQALALTNSQVVVDESRVLAGKLGDAAASVEQFITAAFEQILTRPPTAGEVTACEAFLSKQEALNQGKPIAAAAARESLVRSLFNHNDFVTIR